MNVAASYKALIEKAKEAENNEQSDKAAKFYHDAMKAGPSNALSYERLMIIYRKQKKYKEELKVINEGIKFFQQQHEHKLQQLSGDNKKIVQLSNAFMKSAGLKDKNGKNLYYPEPILKWLKRKQVVEKKLGD